MSTLASWRIFRDAVPGEVTTLAPVGAQFVRADITQPSPATRPQVEIWLENGLDVGSPAVADMHFLFVNKGEAPGSAYRADLVAQTGPLDIYRVNGVSL